MYNGLVIENKFKKINLSLRGDFVMKSRRVLSLLAVAALATTVFVDVERKKKLV